ncbi:MAG: hypothetical protein ACLQDY_02795 [Streptosporangiaceae bacterium]
MAPEVNQEIKPVKDASSNGQLRSPATGPVTKGVEDTAVNCLTSALETVAKLAVPHLAPVVTMCEFVIKGIDAWKGLDSTGGKSITLPVPIPGLPGDFSLNVRFDLTEDSNHSGFSASVSPPGPLAGAFSLKPLDQPGSQQQAETTKAGAEPIKPYAGLPLDQQRVLRAAEQQIGPELAAKMPDRSRRRLLLGYDPELRFCVWACAEA